MNTNKRSRMTVASRSSANTVSTGTTADTSSLSRFVRSRSNSMSTTATSALDEDGKSIKSFVASLDPGSRSSRKSGITRKLVKARSKSPMTAGESGSEGEPVRSASRQSSDWTDADDDDDAFEEGETIGTIARDSSDFVLSQRLALARQNSQNQTEQHFGSVTPGEETIYEYEGWSFGRASLRVLISVIFF